jgi:KaiC/GvpD/RAD55 family RecA-like ATPase
MTRFYHAFNWEAVIDGQANLDIGGLVLIFNIYEGGANKILNKVPAENKADFIVIDADIYSDRNVDSLIAVCNKPDEQTWVEWVKVQRQNGIKTWWFKELEKRIDDLHVGLLVLLDHANRTKNLHKILAETNLTVFSSTEKQVNKQVGTNSAGKAVIEPIPDARWLYGRPPLPEFEYLADDIAELYRRDRVEDLNSIIPVYDFSARSFSYKQLVDAPVKDRAPLVLLHNVPLLWSESITELFAWRGTGKTMFSLGLALHLAAGQSMPGLQIPSPKKVLYVEGELPKAQLIHRIEQLKADLELGDNFEVMGKSLHEHRKSQAAVNIKTEAGRLAIEAAIDSMGAEVLILDSIASLAQINTNNEEQWLPIIEWLVELRCKGLCIVYLQQAGKGGEQRGHSVSEDRIDLAIKLTATNTNPEGAAFAMSFTKEREGSLTPLRLKCTKGVWALDGEKQATKQQTSKDEKILEALDRGESQDDIAKRFKVSKRTISELKKGATNNDSTLTNVQS